MTPSHTNWLLTARSSAVTVVFLEQAGRSRGGGCAPGDRGFPGIGKYEVGSVGRAAAKWLATGVAAGVAFGLSLWLATAVKLSFLPNADADR
jgi:multidrug efflux pump subunit AcrB